MRIIRAVALAAMMASPAQAAEEMIVKTDYLACNSERLFERSEKVRKSGDEKAFHAFTTGALLSESCVQLKSGMTVYNVAGKPKGAGIVKVRPKGSFKTFFTSELAFQ
jgi:hypothetical protein